PMGQPPLLTVTAAPNAPPVQVCLVIGPTMPVFPVVVTTTWSATSTPGIALPPWVSVQPVAALLSVSNPIANDALAAYDATAATSRMRPMTNASTAGQRVRGQRCRKERNDMAASGSCSQSELHANRSHADAATHVT